MAFLLNPCLTCQKLFSLCDIRLGDSVKCICLKYEKSMTKASVDVLSARNPTMTRVRRNWSNSGDTTTPKRAEKSNPNLVCQSATSFDNRERGYAACVRIFLSRHHPGVSDTMTRTLARFTPSPSA